MSVERRFDGPPRRDKMSLMPAQDYFRDNVALRNDTILGVCEALGQDLGFNPMFLRVPLAAGIIFAPLTMVGIYLALAVIVFVSRTFMPNKAQRIARSEAPTAAPEAHNEQVELSRAA
jgi:phage shock protein PspC (stress-responsive transcriptional regulator)